MRLLLILPPQLSNTFKGSERGSQQVAGLENSPQYYPSAHQTHRIARLLAECLIAACCRRYGIMGIGAVCHTLNPRLFPKDLTYIANHAEDCVLVFDLTFLELVEALQPHLKTVKAYVIMTDAAHMPKDCPKVSTGDPAATQIIVTRS